ncbi:MAG: PAS domain-containing protein [Deltaproteobacteria bacterium]|nr:PAS domain-containing protein [Deltaproteobacteria bacterium]
MRDWVERASMSGPLSPGDRFWWNRHCRRIFGYDREKAEGKSILDLLERRDSETKVRDIVTQVFRGESFFNLKWEIRTAAGDIRWVMTNVQPYQGMGSDVEMGICVNVDVTYRQKLPDQAGTGA